MDPGSGGYHVLKVQEGSPGHKAGLEAFFDFIISINDSRLQQDSESIKDLLLKYKDTPVRLVHTESFTPSSIPPPAPLPANLFELIQPPPSQPPAPLPPASPTQTAPGTATEPAASNFQQQQQQLLPGLAQPPPPAPPSSQPYSVGAIPQQQYASPPQQQQQYPVMMPQQQFYTPQQPTQQPSTMFYPSTAPPPSPNYGTVNSVPLIPTTNVALPGMPPISVPMPPTDLLTGQSYGGFPVHSGVEQ
nr:unnamed protein product [Spirometra erinaceieuropaei]